MKSIFVLAIINITNLMGRTSIFNYYGYLQKNITENYDISKTSKNTSWCIFQNNTLKFQKEHITMVMI